jgi:peptide-methionine (S)-S-oxide reductase
MSRSWSRIAPAVLAVGATMVLLGAVRGPLGGGHTGRIPEPTVDLPLAKRAGQQKAVLSGGCFWGVASVFQHVKGVTAVLAGYAGGEAGTATYEEVSTGSTGHAESVQITYDPSQVTYGQLLKVFFSVAHDPTEVNRQGPDDGTQYRSVIFYSTPDQKRVADAYIAQLSKAAVFTRPIATQVVALPAFYEAESYHQNYAELHPDSPYIYINDRPKVVALRAEWPALYRDVPTAQ